MRLIYLLKKFNKIYLRKEGKDLIQLLQLRENLQLLIPCLMLFIMNFYLKRFIINNKTKIYIKNRIVINKYKPNKFSINKTNHLIGKRNAPDQQTKSIKAQVEMQQLGATKIHNHIHINTIY